MSILVSISTRITMLDTYSKIIALSFQGKDFTPAMKQLGMHRTLHCEEERKHSKEVSPRHPPWRTAQGLEMGAITVKSLLAASRHQGHTRAAPAANPRGQPACRAAVHRQPVIRADGRTTHGAGQRVGVGQLRPSLIEPHQAASPPVPLGRTLPRGGFTSGPGKRRSALKERDSVVLARRRSLRQQRATRPPDGSLQRPAVARAATCVQQHHAGPCPWYLAEEGPWVTPPAGKGPRWRMVHAMTVAGGGPGAALVFEATTRTGEEHGHRHWAHGSTGGAEPWLPPLPSPALIIVATAPYHNVLVEDTVPPPRGVQHRAAPGCPGRRSPGRLTGESPNGTSAAKNARPLPPVAWTKEPKPLGIACCGHRRLLRHASLSRHAGAWSQTTGRTMGLVPPATFTTSDRLRSRRSRQAPGVNCSRRSSNKKKNTGRKMRNAPQTISRKFLRRRRGLQTKNRIKSSIPSPNRQ